VAPTYFYLSSRLKSALQGRRFCDASDTIRNATKELKKLSQNSTFQTPLRLPAEVYTLKENYFEENVA
jgi:hypothetical protein